MGNYLVIAIAALTFVPIVLGILLGLLRGSRRSLLRLILVVLCAVLAFALCGALSNSVLTAQVTQTAEDGTAVTVTIQEYLQNMLGEDMKDLANYIVPMVQSLVKVMLFLALFLVFQLLTWLIVYPICKLFVKPKRVTGSDGRRRTKKRRLLGAVFGLVQGVVVALCLCIIVNGLFAVGNQLTQAANDFNDISQEISGSENGDQSEVAMLSDDEDVENGGDSIDMADISALFEGYNESVFGKMYNNIGQAPFSLISRVNTEDGRTVTLTGQVEAFRGLACIGKEFVKLTNLDYDNLYADGNIETLTEILENVENVKSNLSEEAGETVEGMLTALGDAMGIDAKKFYNIDFAEEAAAFNKLKEYKGKDFSSMSPEEIHSEAKDLVKDLAKSELLLDLLIDQDIDIGNGLSDDQRSEVDSSLDEMVQSGDIDQATADRLRDVFGFNNNGGSGSDGGETESPEVSETPDLPEISDEM